MRKSAKLYTEAGGSVHALAPTRRTQGEKERMAQSKAKHLDTDPVLADENLLQ